jgi:hypothetical protein
VFNDSYTSAAFANKFGTLKAVTVSGILDFRSGRRQLQCQHDGVDTATITARSPARDGDGRE